MKKFSVGDRVAWKLENMTGTGRVVPDREADPNDETHGDKTLWALWDEDGDVLFVNEDDCFLIPMDPLSKAAPDLLAACEQVLDNIDPDTFHAEILKAAIAKAKGTT